MSWRERVRRNHLRRIHCLLVVTIPIKHHILLLLLVDVLLVEMHVLMHVHMPQLALPAISFLLLP